MQRALDATNILVRKCLVFLARDVLCPSQHEVLKLRNFSNRPNATDQALLLKHVHDSLKANGKYMQVQ